MPINSSSGYVRGRLEGMILELAENGKGLGDR
jgi:hypothetical protein